MKRASRMWVVATIHLSTHCGCHPSLLGLFLLVAAPATGSARVAGHSRKWQTSKAAPENLTPSDAAEAVAVGFPARPTVDERLRSAREDAKAGEAPIKRVAQRTQSEMDVEDRQAWEDMGIKRNSAERSRAFYDALISNIVSSVVCLCIFSYLRQRYRLVYQKNSWDNWGYSDPGERSQINDGVVDFETDPKEHWPDEGDDGGPLPRRPAGHFRDWVPASFRLQVHEVITGAGLDQAMLVRFAEIGMSTFALIGLPMCLVILPLHVFLGGNGTNTDVIGRTGFSNIRHGSHLCWVHAFMVWYVVILVDIQIYAGQRNFVKLRDLWLKTLPHIRSSTILVEGIPPSKRTNRALRAFFNEMFEGRDVVESTTIIVRSQTLDFAIAARDAAKKAYEDAKMRQVVSAEAGSTAPSSSSSSSPFDSPRHLLHASSQAFVDASAVALQVAYTEFDQECEAEQQRLREQIAKVEAWEDEDLVGDLDEMDDMLSARTIRHSSVRAAILSSLGQLLRTFAKPEMTPEHQEIDDLYSDKAFVTFRTRYDATMALRFIPYTSDLAEFKVSVAPDPADVEYIDMKQHDLHAKAWAIFGWFLIFLMLVFFLPTVGFIGAFANVHNLAPYDTTGTISSLIVKHPKQVRIWNGFACQMGLNLVLSFLPTTLVLITTLCFQHKARSWFQRDLQKFYFFFLLVFQLLVVSMANTLASSVLDTVEDPLSLIGRLAAGMSQSSTFFLTVFASQWTVISMENMRFVQFIKYRLGTRTQAPEEAKAAAEPEDQDYYGMGARSARYTVLFITGLCFVSLSPLICVVAFMTFALMRLVVGYQVVFAETHKPDLGGDFWVMSLKQVQYGVLIYILCMVGMLAERGGSLLPAALAGVSLIYQLNSIRVFAGRFHWASVTHSELVKLTQKEKKGELTLKRRRALRNTYVQPELKFLEEDTKED
mmetsp:Transcript_133012/g.331907  ORF Transcript_133012/g.331907 Transcript_133012/m.331907 type:complete len:937 (+) Transcript_133012:77-2887(+)